MIVKIFTGMGDLSALEKDVNTWLSAHKIKVNTVKQSYASDGKACHAMISIWYEDLQSVTGI